jgi:hypothetical protein
MNIQGTVLIVNGFTSPFSGTLRVKVSNVMTPPTTFQEQTVFVGTFDQSGNDIDAYTVCTMVMPNPSSLNVSVVGGPFKVGIVISPQFVFISSDIIATGDVL